MLMRRHKSKDRSRGFVRIGYFFRATEAVSVLEYAVLVAVIATVVVAALVNFSGNIASAVTDMAPEITEAASEVDD